MQNDQDIDAKSSLQKTLPSDDIDKFESKSRCRKRALNDDCIKSSKDESAGPKLQKISSLKNVSPTTKQNDINH